MTRPRALAALLAGVALATTIGLVLSRTPVVPAAQATPTPTERAPARLGGFLDAHPPPTKAALPSYGWLLTDTEGIVVRREDDTIAAAILADVRTIVDVSPAARHLSYWTAEARGVRRLYVFDTVTLAPPRVVLEAEEVTKIVPAYSPDERFAAVSVPGRPGLIRVIELASGDATEITVDTTLQLFGWVADGLVFNPAGGIDYVLLDPRTGVTSNVSQTDPRVTRTPAPAFDPGTSAVAQIDRRVPRPDGSAMTYLQFDSTSGGRWYGERAEQSGRRVPVEWTTGGNPVRAIYVGTGPAAATMRYEHAPPRDPDGKLGEARALWLMRQNVAGTISRESVRAMPYADYVGASGARSFQIDPSAIVYEVLIQSSASFETRRGPIPCGAVFALMRSDGRSEGTSGGCLGPTWPTTLPPAFANPHPLDWMSAPGRATPAPTTK